SLACGAQMRGGFHGSARGARAFGGSFGGHHRDALARGYFLGDTAFLYDDYPFGTAMPESAPSQLVLLQSPGTADVPTTRIASLLIELQGDHYVRYGGVARPAQPDAGASRISALETTSRPTMTPSQIAQQPLPPTMLIYRDGHREEVADYAIVGRVIYAHRRNLRNDGQTGYGLNQIQISALDVPATVKTNRDQGVTFVLPSGPNEVVTRP
ncbi:MAG: hypothetical protein WA609_00560, partial [Terriglobales bacterium]